jgi:hypothetical protein
MLGIITFYMPSYANWQHQSNVQCTKYGTLSQIKNCFYKYNSLKGLSTGGLKRYLTIGYGLPLRQFYFTLKGPPAFKLTVYV